MPVFLERAGSLHSSKTDHLKPLRVQIASMQLENQRLGSLLENCKERLAQTYEKSKRMGAVLSCVASCLVSWETSKGRLSAEETLHALKRELSRLQESSN